MRQELERALEAIESACKRIDELKAENKTLKEALAQPEQEPVACPYCKNDATIGAVYYDQNCVGCVKRMTRSKQRTWVGLTMQDVKVIEDNAPSIQMAIFMAEATLKDKNHGNS